MTQIQFDKQGQLSKIQSGLMEGETLFAVYDGKGMGTVAISVGGLIHQVEFRGEEKARHAHDVILHYVMVT